MLTEWTTPFVETKDEYIAWLSTQEYPSYGDLLEKAIELVVDRVDEFPYGEEPDPERIHIIDDGDYQGTLVLVVGATGYQPHNYWVTTVSYGSCSGCDALDAAWNYEKNQDYEAMFLIALHMLQGMHPLPSNWSWSA